MKKILVSIILFVSTTSHAYEYVVKDGPYEGIVESNSDGNVHGYVFCDRLYFNPIVKRPLPLHEGRNEIKVKGYISGKGMVYLEGKDTTGKEFKREMRIQSGYDPRD